MRGAGAGSVSGTVSRTASKKSGTKRRSRTLSKAPIPTEPQSPAQGELLPDGKLYYRIGEVSRITGVKPHVLRYWETEFRWMAPPKSRSKQRLYRRKDIETVFAIKRLLYEERYTIAGARLQLRESGLTQALEDELGAAAAVDSRDAAASQPGRDLAGLREGLGRVRRDLQAIRVLLG